MFKIHNCLARDLVAGAMASVALLPVSATQAATESVVYSFCSRGGTSCTDGGNPQASLIDVGGILYGTTYFGGATDAGSVFKLNAATGAETVLYSFCSQANCMDGEETSASLLYFNGTLYGTTYYGGVNGEGYGTVFKVNHTTGAEAALYSFCSQANCTDGIGPRAGLIDIDGILYGTTLNGGANGTGTVFKVNRTTGAETVVYSFCSQANCTDGASPQSGLINVGDTLYGTTAWGGTYNSGTVFKVNRTNGAETVVYSFCRQANCTDGSAPYDGLIDIGGILYGTTVNGGANGTGTVFTVKPTTGVEAVLHSFCSQANCTDGSTPYAGLINVSGILYGTTVNGGANGYGTVFNVNRTTGAETVVYSFCSHAGCTDGANPYAGLINVHGPLYGTTYNGGANGGGTVFKITLP